MRGSSKLVWVQAALFGLVTAAFAAACGGTGETGSSGTANGECTPGAQQGCSCSNNTQGTQVCGSDGQFGACDCGGGSGGGTGTGGSNTTTGTSMGACGDGVEQPGECDVGSEFYCPQDCNPGTGGAGGGNGCTGHVYYEGKVDGAPPVWAKLPNAGGLTGKDAGDNACKAIGADHACDHEEVMAAAQNKEAAFMTIAAGTSAWMHRTTPVVVGGQTYAPGPGGRCNDWKYETNHISDGEYYDFLAAGTPDPKYDNDTFFDGVDTSHQQPGFNCGGITRAILCCKPACTP